MIETRLQEAQILEVFCESCHGKGYQRCDYGDGSDVCARCDGAGYVPTEFGRKVLALMQHNFKSMHTDVHKDE